MENYQEIQTAKPLWVWAIVLLVAVGIWWTFVSQVVLGRGEGPTWLPWLLLVVFGIGLPALFFTWRMIVTVGPGAVHVQVIPLTQEHIPYDQITHVEARQYQPIREYGGWGVRFGRDGKRAYNMRGNEGVELTLKDGTRLMLGSQEPELLVAAIRGKI